MFGEKNNLLLYQHLKSFSQYCSASYLGLFIQQLSKSFSLTIFFCQLSRMAKCPSPTSPTSCSGEIWTGFSSTMAHTIHNCFEEIFCPPSTLSCFKWCFSAFICKPSPTKTWKFSIARRDCIQRRRKWRRCREQNCRAAFWQHSHCWWKPGDKCESEKRSIKREHSEILNIDNW